MKKLFYLFTIVVGLSLASCSGDDDPEVKFPDKEISYGQTYTIPNGEKAVWKSSNTKIASVSGNVVTANKVGEVVISSEEGSFKLAVTPTSTLAFAEPCIDWDADINAVKAFMKNISGFTLTNESNGSLHYDGTGEVVSYYYSFRSSTGKLESSQVSFSSDFATKAQFIDYLEQRYIYDSKIDVLHTTYYLFPDNKVSVCLIDAEGSINNEYTLVYGNMQK